VFVALAGDGPMYLRLYRGLRDAIRAGRVPPKSVLPSTRHLADELKLSRNTVLRAYEQLIAEGFAVARHGGGTFVAEDIVSERRPSSQVTPIALAAGGRRIVDAAAANPFAAFAGLPRVHYDFLFGVPDSTLFPIAEWRKSMSRCIDRASKRALAYDAPSGAPRLRELVAAHLIKHRGVRCDRGQVVIVGGAQQAFDLLARVLVEPGDPVLVEDPCYPAIRSILQAAGASLVPAPVDGEGIDLSLADARRDSCRVAYVTPSHQFPSGAVMSSARREALLAWAERTGAIVIEDDYDSDFRHAGKPIQALQGLDTTGRVVHVGTFSKSLFPSLRLGYLVAPPSLVRPLVAAKWITDWSSSLLLQNALADFIERGLFTRHLKRSSAVYARRRDALVAALDRELGSAAVVAGGQAGMHLLVWLPRVSTEELDAAIVRARDLGVGVYSVAMFYATPPPRAAIVLGYAGLPEQHIRDGIALFARALRGSRSR
jgi:GntR family transcriptional regulator/MocR family aminotransferase